jgi:sulfite oxidase
LIIRSADPLNAEPALPDLVAQAVTPVKHFYIRNHGPTPKPLAAGFKLRIEGLVNRAMSFSLGELRERFGQQSAEATLTCAGNRRKELSQIKAVGGVQWDAGAIGHSRWTGARLTDLLQAAELQAGAKHVWFEGLDSIKEKDGSAAPFGASIPLDKALAPDNPALIAQAMNDQPLIAEHGFPARMIVPGYIGARSVKWLTKIVVSDRPSPNHYVAEAYKLIQAETKEALSAADPIYSFPVNAAICAPGAGAMLKAGRHTIAGYALPSGEKECTVEKVEVSRDGGRTWTGARFISHAHPLVWRLWTAELELPAGRHELAVRATDSRGQAMPDHGDWNVKGYLYNAWHRVTVNVA